MLMTSRWQELSLEMYRRTSNDVSDGLLCSGLSMMLNVCGGGHPTQPYGAFISHDYPQAGEHMSP